MSAARTRRGLAPRTRAQRILTALGVLLLVGGLAAFGWIGWEMFGTNWVSHRKQADAIDAIHRQWDEGKDVAEVDAGRVTSIVRIPRFGKDYAVPLLEGTSDDVLASGFGHYADTADPGEVGNFALAGHRVTHGEPLRSMPDLRPGDRVIVETRRTVFTYVLDTGGEALVVPFTDTWVIDPLPANPRAGGVQPAQDPGQRLLTLTSCAELFHTDTRIVAFGHLDSRDPRT